MDLCNNAYFYPAFFYCPKQDRGERKMEKKQIEVIDEVEASRRTDDEGRLRCRCCGSVMDRDGNIYICPLKNDADNQHKDFCDEYMVKEDEEEK